MAKYKVKDKLPLIGILLLVGILLYSIVTNDYQESLPLIKNRHDSDISSKVYINNGNAYLFVKNNLEGDIAFPLYDLTIEAYRNNRWVSLINHSLTPKRWPWAVISNQESQSIAIDYLLNQFFLFKGEYRIRARVYLDDGYFDLLTPFTIPIE